MRLVVVDNQDSFTWNLVHMLGAHLGRLPEVLDHRASLAQLKLLSPDAVVLSAGPGRPDRNEDFGVCAEAIEQLDVPILGVCLGHQGLGLIHGAALEKAPVAVHGYRSRVYHDNDALMRTVVQGAHAVRYHSLCLGQLPAHVKRIAWSDDGVTMGIRVDRRPQWGIQFHPESILTHFGSQLTENFLQQAQQHGALALTCSEERSAPTEQEISVRTGRMEVAIRSRQIAPCPAPENVFKHLFGSSDAFWFDGALDARARYSHMGSLGPAVSFSELERAVDSPRAVAREGTGFVAPFAGGWVCGLAYEALEEGGFDSADPSILRAVDRWISWDHVEQRCALYARVANDDERSRADAWFDEVEQWIRRLPKAARQLPRPKLVSTTEVSFSCSDATYRQRVTRAKEYLADGESYEICLTDRASFEIDDDPLDYYLRLRIHNPAPYAAFVRVGTRAVASASPELFLEVSLSGRCITRPIKGTAPRSDEPAVDHAHAAELRMPRFVAENLMIVDLLRNDLGRVCELGSVQVPRLMEVESHPHVHQLVSTIEGQLRPGLTAIDAIRAAFPGGSMTGAPKRRTMQILAELEHGSRGLYAGALGYIGLDGQAMLSIVIRTAVFDGKTATVGSGGAIVMASDPEDELAEAKLKVRPLLSCRSVRT